MIKWKKIQSLRQQESPDLRMGMQISRWGTNVFLLNQRRERNGEEFHQKASAIGADGCDDRAERARHGCAERYRRALGVKCHHAMAEQGPDPRL